ncbi:hypothetical protein [Ferruginibacter sp.]
MKLFAFVVSLFFTTAVYSQQCSCATDSSLSEIISCEKILFKNNAQLYWQYNCDSSWLTFVSSAGKKNILYSLDDGLQIYTEKLGYSYAAEYNASFLIQNNLISGCCTPPEYLLFNKATGKEIKNLGSLIFYSEEIKYPLVVFIEPKKMNSLLFYNVNTQKNFSVALPVNKIATTLKKGAERYAEYLFEETDISQNTFSTSLRYQQPGNNDKWYNYKIVVDLKKYGYQ